MTTKRIIMVSLAIACIAVGFAIYFNGDKEPDFTGKRPEEIKAYFKSEEFKNKTVNEQIAIKKKAYAPFYRQREREFIEHAKRYTKLPQPQKAAYLDKMIDQLVSDAKKKQQRYAKKIASSGAKAAQDKPGSVNKAKPGGGKKRLSADDYRNWSEKMEPQKRAYIMELKEALRQRMEQRGIEIKRHK